VKKAEFNALHLYLVFIHNQRTEVPLPDHLYQSSARQKDLDILGGSLRRAHQCVPEPIHLRLFYGDTHSKLATPVDLAIFIFDNQFNHKTPFEKV
jgi:hypothetical protein